MRKLFLFPFISLIMSAGAFAQTEGLLTVTVTTSQAGGNYAPKNIVAIWIETGEGDFIKTLLAYAATRKTHLNIWEASTTAAGSPFNTVNAITGATRSSHATRTCTWDGTDVAGNLVPDGTYLVWMELTDKNNTGNYSSFTIEKATEDIHLTPANVPSFGSISIVWDASVTAVGHTFPEERFQVYPNPNNGIFRVCGDGITDLEVINTAGSLIYSGVTPQVDISGHPFGIYYVKIVSEKGIEIKKVLHSKLQ
jgi:hypothetical protein